MSEIDFQYYTCVVCFTANVLLRKSVSSLTRLTVMRSQSAELVNYVLQEKQKPKKSLFCSLKLEAMKHIVYAP